MTDIEYKVKEDEARINQILELLLKCTARDFLGRVSVAERGDKLDAIINNLNSVVDELENNRSLLTKATQGLEYANKELDSFSYSVSHDLRAPLRGINGYAQTLLEDHGDKLDEDGKRCIAVIMRNSLRMGNLIDDLLAFYRIGKINISRASLNMNSIVKTIVDELKFSDNNKASFDIQSLSDVDGDSSLMTQAMTNLIGNAVKYSSKKEKPLVEIGSYKQGEDIVYYVKDNGAGFDMKYYDKLFGVFQRLHSPTEFEGTGVGLALVQRIIKKHHGEIWAEAKPGEGAIFSFTIRLKNN